MKSVLYIGNFSFPLGNAAGKRVYANGKILKELGYEVIFIGMDSNVNSIESLSSTKQNYDGFTFYNLPYPKKNRDWIKYMTTFKILTKFLEDEKIVNRLSLVIYYGSPSLSIFNTKLISYCKNKEIKVVSDCVDWLTTKTKNPVFNIIKWADNTYQKAYANKKADGVITISSYLSNYYKKSGCNTTIIPPLSPSDSLRTVSRIKDTDKKVITYAGIPFRIGQPVADVSKLKDRIDKTIILLNKARLNGCDFIFNIYGFTKKEYLEAIPTQKEYVVGLGESVVFHGHKSNEEVVENVSKSDFTILIRDINRDTKAGFPTKISESISHGTPVITTKTSDLDKYIVENKNGFFIDFEDEKALSSLQEILNKENKDIQLMKKNCIESRMFHYTNYVNQTGCFLRKINRTFDQK